MSFPKSARVKYPNPLWPIVGNVGIINNFCWFEPKEPLSSEDVIATAYHYQWYNNWLMEPIFTSTGDYPRLMRDRVANFSRAQGFPTSRLPVFTEEEIRDLQGSADFLGFSYEIHQLVEAQDPSVTEVSIDNDSGILRKTYQLKVYKLLF